MLQRGNVSGGVVPGNPALFTLPALEIDQDVDGLLVIRGITISLSSLTIVAHGIELGMKLADDIELAMYADEAWASSRTVPDHILVSCVRCQAAVGCSGGVQDGCIVQENAVAISSS